MSHNRSSSVVALALLFAFAVAPRPAAALFNFKSDLILAQSVTPTSFPSPDTVTEGTTVRIDGSNSMAAVNQSLKQQFEEQYADTTVEVNYSGTTAALQALQDGAVDLVALGRPLTAEEKAQGLTEVPVGRSKIAIIVGDENPFDENLTFEQFAQIFRGEIIDWADVGGQPGPIRLVDHPEDSDTRQAFPQYPVFQTAPFETGATAEPLTEDTADAIVNALGSDGISYIAANQVIDRPGVRVLSMHQTLPSDPRYPYSQPLLYVYQGEPSPAVAAFLGFLTSSAGLEAVNAAGDGTVALLGPIVPAAASSVGAGAASPTTEAPIAVEPSPEPATPAVPPGDRPRGAATPDSAGALSTDDRGALPWWLWLLPLLLGIPLLAWLLRGRRGAPAEEVPPVAPAPASSPGPTLAERAGTVISADRTSIQEPIPSVVADPVATIPPVDPAVSPTLTDAAVVGAVTGGAMAGLAAANGRPNRIIFTPRTANQAYAYWETPEDNQAALRQQGGDRYTLRVFDVTDIDLEQQPPHSIQEFACAETDRDRHVPHLQSERDYLAEIGYLTPSDQWLMLARSAPIRMPAVSPLPETEPDPEQREMVNVDEAVDAAIAAEPLVDAVPTSAAIGPLVAGAALAGAALTPEPVSRPNHIVLTVHNSQQAEAEWHVPTENQEAARQQGGRYYTLRVCDVTGIDANTPPHSFYQFACHESDTTRLVPIPQAERDYIAEIGYLTEQDDWLLLARSAPVRVAAPIAEDIPSELTFTDLAKLDPIALADGKQEAVEAAKFDVGQSDLRGEMLADVDATLAELPSGYGDSQIFLLPRDPNWAYTYWDVPIAHKELIRQQGGTRLALRFYDVTGISLDEQRPHSLQQYDCEELARDWYIPVPVSDRDYIVEIGYLTNDGQWLMLARSTPTRIPPTYPTDWLDEQFITVSWDDDLQGQTLVELAPPEHQTSYRSPIYDRIFNMVKSAEAQRVAGSLFGSMQQTPEQSISSYAVSGLGLASVTESGLGMMSGVGAAGMSGVGAFGMSGAGIASGAAISTLSGVGMSGVGLVGAPGVTLSGIGMSGVGMSGIGMSGVGMGSVSTMSGIGMSGAGLQSMSGVGAVGMSGVGLYSMSGISSGVGILGAGLTMSGVGMSGVGMYSVPTMSGIGMSGVGMGLTMSGVGMSGVGMSGVGMSGIGMLGSAELTMSGVGMSGIGMGLTMSGVGMSGVGMYSIPTLSGAGLTMSGIGMSGVGMGGLTMSGVGMSGVGMYSVPTMSGVGLTMSGVGMSGVGMYIPTMSGIGMSGVGMGLTMSGVGMSGVGFSASMPPIRPRKFWLVANAELIVHGATEPDATVMIGDREIKLSPDGTFRFQVAFPDGDIDYPILAVAADGEQTRSIHMDFNRETPVRHTNTKDEATEEWL